MCPEYNLKWGENSFNMLGVEYNVDLHKTINLNYDKN